jgi:methylmalonyl-CoA/ethylmalonyl-CoA epimerase
MENPPQDGYRITQIGYVVADLERTMKAYHHAFGWGPWRVYDVVPPQHHHALLRGRPVEGGTRIAIASCGTLDIELIQPLHGESQHAEFLSQHGPSINHILVRRYEDGVEISIDPSVLGLPSLASGSFGEGVHYNYLDGREEFATLLEIVQGSTAELGMVPTSIYPAAEGE